MDIKNHDNYNDIISRSEMLLDSYKGGLQVLNKNTYIFQYPTETEKAYKKRRSRAVIYNYFRPIVNSFSDAIFSKPIKREAQNERLVRFIDNASTDGKALSRMMKKISVLSTFLQVGILIDAPKVAEEKLSKDTIIEKRLFPYISIIYPEKILNWYFDDKGLSWVILKDFYTDKSDPKSFREIKRYVLWTREYWQEFIDEDKKELTEMEPVPHNLGEVPFRFVQHSDIDDDGVWESSVEEIAMAQRQIANWMSALDENIHSTCHSSISIPIGDHAEVIRKSIEEKKDQGAKIQFHESGSPPVFLRDELINITSILEAVKAEITEIYRMAGLTMQSKENYWGQSGASKEYDYEMFNTILINKARALESLENWILLIVSKYQGDVFNKEDQTIYPDDFKVVPIVDQLKNDMQAISAAISPTFSKYAKKQFVKDAFPEMAEDDTAIYDEIIKEIDGVDTETIPIVDGEKTKQ